MRAAMTMGWSMAAAMAVSSGVPRAHASEPAGLTDHVDHADHADHHHRPARYNDITLEVPVPSGADPQYPLAVAFVPAHSSNYTAGGLNSYDYVVVHTMQGYYAGSMSWFQNPDANVSAHYLMRAEDGEITQMVRHEDRAWHVGGSNSQALGIEHEGFITEPEWYTWQTYLSSARLTRWLCHEFDIPVDRDHVVGHVELPNQSHTDPGNFWDWELYMALIRDTVPPEQIQGVVVDRSMACTVTANADTWIKTTPQDADALDDASRCLVPAGTELTIVHAGDDLVQHVRLTFDADGSPCAGALAEEGFVVADDLDGWCDPQSMVAPGASLILDDGEPVAVDAEGRFVLDAVAPGAHMLDAFGDGYEPEVVPVDVEIHPGARVVVALDPQASGETGDDPTGGAPGLDSDSGSPGDTADVGGDDLPGGTGGSSPTGGGSRGGGALPPGYGQDDDGCGCTHGQRPATGAWMLALLVLAPLRRRRR